MSRTQLNVRVGESVRKCINLDKANTFATKDIIVEVALKNWFDSKPPKIRETCYKAHSRKPYVTR